MRNMPIYSAQEAVRCHLKPVDLRNSTGYGQREGRDGLGREVNPRLYEIITLFIRHPVLPT